MHKYRRLSGGTREQPSRSPVEARELLLTLRGLQSQEAIAKATGIHQGQVSRLLSGKFVRVSGNALILCNYANDVLDSELVAESQLRQKLVSSALSLWDGSAASGTKVIALLEVLNTIVRAPERR